MASQLIFVPVLTHILMVVMLYLLLLIKKKKALKSHKIDLKATALNCKAWPDDVFKVSNNLDNQFEAPVMFYAVCVILFCLKAVSPPAVILAWTFALSRFVHAYVHTTSNYVPVRMKVFSLGIVSLVGLVGLALYELRPFLF